MNSKLSTQLFLDFPNVFEKLDYFECQDGWEPLIRDLALKLYELGARAVQIKEKFGILRVYTETHSADIASALRGAEQASREVCEKCGDWGMLRNNRSWVKTYCDRCNRF